MDHPDADDYLRLFGRYRDDFGDAYLAPEDERYRLLFEQVCQLLLQPSGFNLGMPQEFRRTARQWTEGEAATLAHMGDPLNPPLHAQRSLRLRPPAQGHGWPGLVRPALS